MRRIGLFTAVGLLLLAAAAAAQTGGQLCVRSFDDRNASGRIDPGEPLLTGGISVNLLDTSGVIIASALLDQSPTAAQGVVCFQGLSASQYSVVITSAEYTATTADTITATVSAAGTPTVLEFGAQRVAADPTGAVSAAPDSLTLPDDPLTRLLVAAGGTLLAVVGMIFLGVVIALVAFRGPPPDRRRITSTGTARAIRREADEDWRQP